MVNHPTAAISPSPCATVSLASISNSRSFFFNLSVPKPASLRSACNKLSRFEQWRPVQDLYFLDPSTANSSACCAGVFSGIRSTWPNMDYLCWFTLTDSGTTLHILYKALLEITLSGQWWLVMVRRCLRWQASSLSRNFFGAAQLLQLYNILWHTGCVV